MTVWLCTSVSVVMLVTGGLVAGEFGGCNMVWWHFLQRSILHEIFDLHLFIKWVFDKQLKQSFLSLIVLILSGCKKSLISGQRETFWLLLLQNQHLYVELLFASVTVISFGICYVVVDYIYCPYFCRNSFFCVFTCFNYCSNWIEHFG